MEFNAAATIVSAVTTFVGGVWGLIFYYNGVDIWTDALQLKLKNAKSTLSAVIEFIEVHRSTRGGPNLLGQNIDVLALMYPRRYLYEGLKIWTFVTGAATVISTGISVFGVESIGDPPELRNLIMAAESDDVRMSVVAAISFALLFYVPIVLSFFQRRSVKSAFARLRQNAG